MNTNRKRRKNVRATFVHKPTRCELLGINNTQPSASCDPIEAISCGLPADGRGAERIDARDCRRNPATLPSEFGRTTNAAPPRKEALDSRYR